MFEFTIKSKLGTAIASLDTDNENAIAPIEWSGNAKAQKEIQNSLFIRHCIADECSCLDLVQVMNDEFNSPNTHLYISLNPQLIQEESIESIGEIPIDDSELILSTLQTEAEGDHGDLTEIHP